MRIGWLRIATLLVGVSTALPAAAQDDLPPLPPTEDDAEQPPPPPPPPPPAPRRRRPPPPPPPEDETPPPETGEPQAPDPGNPWSPGFYLRISQAPSFAKLHASSGYNAPSDWGFGGTFDVAVGATLAEGFSLAGFVHGDVAGSVDDVLVLVGLGVTADWHPAPTTGWRLGGSLGLSDVSVSAENDASAAGDAMFALFGGYDWRLSRRWGLGIEGRFTYYTPASIRQLGDQAGASVPTAAAGYDVTQYWRFSTAIYSLGVSGIF